MESLESIREGKLYWEDEVKTYSEHFLAKLQELYPSNPMFLRCRFPIPFESGYNEAHCRIKKGKGILDRLNPFAKTLVKIETNFRANDIIPGTVTVLEDSLRENIDNIVKKLNEESGESFRVIYS